MSMAPSSRIGPGRRYLAVVFRVEASPAIGRGHVARCLGLAKALARKGLKPHFVLSAQDLGVRRWIRDNHWPIHELSSSSAWISPRTLINYASRWHASVIVIDSYKADSAYFKTLQENSDALIVQFDDFGKGPFYSSVIIRSKPKGIKADLQGAGPLVLEGPSYIPLPPALLQNHPHKRSFQGPPYHLLITLGCSHVEGQLSLLLRSLQRLPETIQLHVAGPALVLKNIRSIRSSNILFHSDPVMAPLYRQAHLAICAGGMTSLELAYSGVPMCCWMIAENQRGNIRELLHSGCAELVTEKDLRYAETFSARIYNLIADPQKLSCMSESGRKLVDGKSGDRVASKIISKTREFRHRDQ